MPDDAGIGDPVHQFIWEYISSVAQLEILLLLQTNPQQVWTTQQIAQELRIETAGAAVQLEALANAGLARKSSPDSYGFASQNPEHAATIIALAQAYLARRVTVIGLIFSRPSDKIRLLSDAFRFRKGPPHGS